jgi:hypothetical protein
LRPWLDEPRIRVIEPDPRHAAMLERFVSENPAVGDFLTDAAPAALAAGQGADPALADGDFSRFSIFIGQTRWRAPGDEPGGTDQPRSPRARRHLPSGWRTRSSTMRRAVSGFS